MTEEELKKVIWQTYKECKEESFQMFPENTEKEKSGFFYFSLGCGYAIGKLLDILRHKGLRRIT